MDSDRKDAKAKRELAAKLRRLAPALADSDRESFLKQAEQLEREADEIEKPAD